MAWSGAHVAAPVCFLGLLDWRQEVLLLASSSHPSCPCLRTVCDAGAPNLPQWLVKDTQPFSETHSSYPVSKDSQYFLKSEEAPPALRLPPAEGWDTLRTEQQRLPFSLPHVPVLEMEASRFPTHILWGDQS